MTSDPHPSNYADQKLPIENNSISCCCPSKGIDAAPTALHVPLLTDSPHTYDQCLQHITATSRRFQWLLLAGTGIACMAVLIEENCMAFVLPAARCTLRISVRMQGALYVATTAGFVCAAPLWGFAADTWGRRNALSIGLALSGCASAASAASPDAGWLMAGRFAVGVCVAGIKGTAMSYVGEFHVGGGDRGRPVHLALLSSAMWTTALVQPLVAWAVLGGAMTGAEEGGGGTIAAWRVFILLGSGWSLMAAAVMFVLPESPKFLLAVGRPEEALRVLATMWRWNGSGSKCAPQFDVKRLAPLDATVASGDNGGNGLANVRSVADVGRLMAAQLRPLLQRPYRADMLLCCAFAFGTFFVCHGWLVW